MPDTLHMRHALDMCCTLRGLGQCSAPRLCMNAYVLLIDAFLRLESGESGRYGRQMRLAGTCAVSRRSDVYLYRNSRSCVTTTAS